MYIIVSSYLLTTYYCFELCLLCLCTSFFFLCAFNRFMIFFLQDRHLRCPIVIIVRPVVYLSVCLQISFLPNISLRNLYTDLYLDNIAACPLHIAWIVTKTCLYNFDPLKPHFYIVKLGFTGVYVIFLISAQNIYCGYSLEPPRRCGSNEYPQSMFWAEIWKISEFFIWKFSVLEGEIFYTFE